jgi:hypothetical protein
MLFRPLITILIVAGSLSAQEGTPAPRPGTYTIESGTKVPLSLINSVSTKHAEKGDHVYLETAFPVLVNRRIVIPVGSWVMGTVTEVKKPGRIKGRGELYIRFDTLILPNGVTRDFRARMGGMDASSTGVLDRAEGTVKSEGNKAGDARVVAETSAAGASVGAIAGNAASHGGMGLGIGAAAGAAGGLIYVLASRGPDAIVAKGSTLEMVLDRALNFEDADLNFPPQAVRQNAPGGM